MELTHGTRKLRRPPLIARALACAVGIGVLPIGSAVLEAQGVAPALLDSARHTRTAARASPSRDAAEVDRAGQRYAAAVRHCYQEEGLKHDPELGGLLRVALTVPAGGDVRGTRVTATRVHGLGMPAVISCVSAAARSWRFREGAFREERLVLWFDLLPPAD